MAFVVVMHLDAKQKSLLAELLQRCTKMPVQVLTRKARPKPGQVYVAPPGVLVSIDQGALRTESFEQSKSHRLPIDAFFRSLALDQGANAIGVVLSGTGSDGTLGIRAIKAEHGMVIVQDKSAKYGGMPCCTKTPPTQILVASAGLEHPESRNSPPNSRRADGDGPSNELWSVQIRTHPKVGGTRQPSEGG